MGRRISKEFLHPSILEGVNNKIGNLDSLETDAKGNMVQAINELVEKLDNSAEIENGKELIANAVGEPLTAEDSFDEMSNDINSLLSTFKTNMMNNGITVESNDRFKSLIDKIATMVEEGSGKGIQIIEGTANFNKTNYEISFTIDFEPYLILICHDFTSNREYKNYYLYYPSVYPDALSWYLEDSVLMESDITETHTIVKNGSVYTLQNAQFEGTETSLTFTAIGVGEEDTTLRDSLASILENKGVDVTEEDDMASLISKVDSINVLLPATSSDSGVKTHYHLYMPTYTYTSSWNDEDNIDSSNNPAFLQCYVAPLADNMDVIISINLATSGNSMIAYCQINVNGEKKHLFEVNSNSAGVDKTYTYSAKAGDYIELYLATSRSSATVRNVKIYSYYKTI